MNTALFKTTRTASIAAAAVGVALATGITMAYAQSVDSADAPVNEAEKEVIMQEREAHREAVKSAVEEGSYDEWASLMREHNQERYDRMNDLITEENFEALQNGEQVKGFGHGKGKHGMKQFRDAMVK